jgi:glutaredoxin
MDNKINLKASQIFNKIKSNNNTFLIFGLSTCKYCKNAIEYSINKSLQFKYYEMDKYYDIFIPILNKLSNLDQNLNIDPMHDTFPVIFYNNKFIGGYSQLITFFSK